MLIMMRGKIAGVIAVFMGTRGSRYRGGNADRAAHNGEHAHHQQKLPQHLHEPTLSRLAASNNAYHVRVQRF